MAKGLESAPSPFSVREEGDFVLVSDADGPFFLYCRSQRHFDLFRFGPGGGADGRAGRNGEGGLGTKEDEQRSSSAEVDQERVGADKKRSSSLRSPGPEKGTASANPATVQADLALPRHYHFASLFGVCTALRALDGGPPTVHWRLRPDGLDFMVATPGALEREGQGMEAGDGKEEGDESPGPLTLRPAERESKAGEEPRLKQGGMPPGEATGAAPGETSLYRLEVRLGEAAAGADGWSPESNGLRPGIDEKRPTQKPPYRFRFQARLRRQKQRPLEAFNLYLGGLENAHPGFGRPEPPRYTLWSGRDGRMRRHPNSHAFAYLAVPMVRGKYLGPAAILKGGKGDGRGGAGRSGESAGAGADPRDGALPVIGFGWSEGPGAFNPLWAVERAEPRLGLVSTCDMFFDQHLMLDPPGLEDRDAAGLFPLAMDLSLFNLAPADMKALAEGAAEVDVQAVPGLLRQGLVLNPEGETALESLVPVDSFYRGPLCVLPSWHKGAEALAFKESPFGPACLCFDPARPGEAFFNQWEPRPTYPPGRRIRLRVEGEAQGLSAPLEIGLCTTRQGWSDVEARALAEPVLGDGPFLREVEIENGDFQFVTPFFHRRGNGGAWFRKMRLSSR